MVFMIKEMNNRRAVLSLEEYKQGITSFQRKVDSSIKESELYPPIILVKSLLDQFSGIAKGLGAFNGFISSNKLLSKYDDVIFMIPLGNIFGNGSLSFPYDL